MKSKKPGRSSSKKQNRPQILNLSPLGMWILVGKKEYYVDHDRYPWFKDASMNELYNVETTGLGSGIYWPDLDIDVELEALEHPARYPLVADIPTKKKGKRAAA